jgi:hypothetical protein
MDPRKIVEVGTAIQILEQSVIGIRRIWFQNTTPGVFNKRFVIGFGHGTFLRLA